MSAVSKNVIPRSIARCTMAADSPASQRWPKLSQPSPSAETMRPERPRPRYSMSGLRLRERGQQLAPVPGPALVVRRDVLPPCPDEGELPSAAVAHVLLLVGAHHPLSPVRGRAGRRHLVVPAARR